MKFTNKRILDSTLMVIIATMIIPGCGGDNPIQPDDDIVRVEVDETGDTIEWKDISIEIPENAISGKATVTLKALEYNLEDSMKVTLNSEAVSIQIEGAELNDTLYISLPSFVIESDWNIVGLKFDGVWYPLNIVNEGVGHLRMAIPPEIFEQGSSRGKMTSATSATTSFAVAAMNVDVPSPGSISLIQKSFDKPGGPAIVLIHGIYSSGARWDGYIDHLVGYGDVYVLEYPWKERFNQIAPAVADILTQELASRKIYFICHSKGGLLARAVIRLNETDGIGLVIEKALYYATPHFGATLANIDSYFDMIYGAIFEFIGIDVRSPVGVTELGLGSSELSVINRPLSFTSNMPLYKCVVGDIIDIQNDPLNLIKDDFVVTVSSADLASQEHIGERENAVYENTLTLDCRHGNLGKYDAETWDIIEEFLVRPVSGTIIVNPDPNELNASWTITGPLGYSHSDAGDQTLSSLSPGEYSITWDAVSGYITPTSAPQTLVPDGTITFSGTYPVDPGPSGDFVYIPPGTFTMGSPTDEPKRIAVSETQHQVTLTKGFYMSKYEVTEQWWYEVMGGTPTTSQLPKNYVSWDMAVAFCNALSDKEGLTPAYTIYGTNGDVTWNRSSNGYRLPTEAEWEYACRAATTMAFNNNTNCLSSDTEANYDGNYPLTGCPAGIYRGARTAVGTFPANDWDLYDMHGNMREWVWDGWRTDYENLGSVDPVYDVGPGANRVVRDGGWATIGAQSCRSALRSGFFPTIPYFSYGLRPVRSAD